MPQAALPLSAVDCISRSHLFWPKVAYGPESQCWEWKAAKDWDGYGFFRVYINGQRRGARAHRVSHLLSGGELSPDQLLLHTCDNPACVNPRHLTPGTCAENMRQKVDRGRMKPQHGEANPANKLTDDVVRQILAVLAKPYPPSQKEIGRQFGVSQMTISLLRQGKIWQHIERTPVLYAQAPLKGSAHARSKLTETDVRVIKMLLARPHPPSQESIGRAYGVSQSTISFIKRGRTWKHVPTPI
jgi:predicted XRE-type DNA-binding protein